MGGVLGLIDGVSTWSLYKLSGESIAERWERELEQIQNENTAQDEKQRENRYVLGKYLVWENCQRSTWGIA